MQKRSNTLIAMSTLVALTVGTFAGIGTPPVQAKSLVRRHPFLTAAGGYLVYRHYHKKHQRQRAAQLNHARIR